MSLFRYKHGVFASGIYFCRLKTNVYTATTRLALIR